MDLATVSFCASSGWSEQGFPDLDSERTLVVVFGASSFFEAPQPLEDLAAAYPRSVVVGCSTSGEIHGAELKDDSLTVAVARFEHTDLRFVSAAVESAGDSRAAGEALARALAPRSEPGAGGDILRGVFVLSEGLSVNGSALTEGLRAALPADVVITGGLAGDGDRFQRTWVLHEGVPVAGRVTAVGFYGDRVRIGFGSKGGWDIFGPERKVTRSRDNVLFQLDGRPALDLYKEYLGDRAQGLPATGLLFPLALRRDADSPEQVVRTILAVNEDDRSLTFAGNVPEGYLAQLMMANFDRLVDGAYGAARLTSERAGTGGPVLAIAVSCVGRRLVLGERTEEEIEAVLDVLPAGTRQVGFYSYGEISPIGALNCDLHNQTMTLTTLAEV